MLRALIKQHAAFDFRRLLLLFALVLMGPRLPMLATMSFEAPVDTGSSPYILLYLMML